MRKFAVALLTIMFFCTACAIGSVSDKRVVGVAAGDAEISSCESADPNSPDCDRVKGGQLSEAGAKVLEAVSGAVSSVVGAVGGIVGGVRGFFGSLFGSSDDSSD